jgi:hypothetical protein
MTALSSLVRIARCRRAEALMLGLALLLPGLAAHAQSSAPAPGNIAPGNEAAARSDTTSSGSAPRSSGGGYIDQTAVKDILKRRARSLDALPEVYYDYYVLDHPNDNSVLARNIFYHELGDGNVKKGEDRAKLVELLNRRLLAHTEMGDTLVVPTEFDLDFRAYSPFPRYYPGARTLPKLFIMHKGVQAWAAYEHGKLTRWGIINTGSDKNPTPSGRFSFNWKQEYRVSTLSPPGEQWEMYWVFNFYHARGMHVHQYEMPTGGPTSHGCVRLVNADAKWIYNWAEPWESSKGPIGPQSAQGRITAPGTPVLVLGENPNGTPKPFEFKRRYPILKRLDLPSAPMSVPAGSPRQRKFDRMTAQR